MRAPALLSRVLCAALLVVACTNRRGGESESRSLGGDVGARIHSAAGTESVPLSVIASVASAQHVSSQEAARRVIDDEILASAARRKGLDRAPPTSWRLTAARASLAVDRLAEEAKRRGPPNDEEVEVLTQKNWHEFARPPAVRVIHAIVLRPKDAAQEARARVLAAELRAAVASAKDDAEFEKNAKAMPADLEVRVESLPAFAADGSITEGGGRMDLTFAKAAFAVTTPGGISPVVESTFGWHVIRLRERVPELTIPIEQRRSAFANEVFATRARESVTARLRALRNDHRVELSPAAESLMRAVSVSANHDGSQAKGEGTEP